MERVTLRCRNSVQLTIASITRRRLSKDPHPLTGFESKSAAMHLINTRVNERSWLDVYGIRRVRRRYEMCHFNNSNMV